MLKRSSLAAVPLAVLVLASAGCASFDDQADTEFTGSSADATVTVAAAFYPLQEAVQRVGGDRVDVVGLTPPGGGPHDLELTPQSLEALEGADGVVYLSKGFQPVVEQAIAGLPGSGTTLDVLDGMDLLPVTPGLEGTQGDPDGEELDGGFDPHVWVSPRLQANIATSVESLLAEIDPDNAGEYAAAADAYRRELAELDGEFAAGLESCDSSTIVTSHRAFEYLARDYDLTQVPIAGISPDEEPDPRSLEAVAEVAREDGVTVVFFESAVPPDLSETVAREIGATTDFLDPIETITQPDLDEGIDYLSIQRRNLESLVGALGCSS